MQRREFLKSLSLGFASLAFVKPYDIVEASENYPSPGKWTLSPDKLVAGDTVDLELRYQNGASSLPPGAYHRVLVEPLSIKTFFHCPPSTDLEVVPFKGKLPVVKLEPKPVNGVGFREVKMIFPEGLKAGESFALKIGNKQTDGNIKALINPIQVENLTFEIYSDFSGDISDRKIESGGYINPWNKTEYKEMDWQKMGWIDYLPKVDIIGNKASALRVFGPSLVQVNKNFDLKISVVDNFDNRACPDYSGKVVLERIGDIENLPQNIKYTDADRCSKAITNLKITKPGVYRVKARLAGGESCFESNPIVVREKVDTPIYWGNIHNHCQYSECWGTDLDTFYSYARDISGMDYVALSDHRAKIPAKGEGVSRLLRWRTGKADSLNAWKDTIAKATKYNKPGKFVTLFGYEWSSMDAGHYNIYVPEARLEDMDEYFTQRYTDYGFNMRRMLKDTEALFIPHGHADMLPFYTLVEEQNAAGKPLTPVVEVYSDWGGMYFPYKYFDKDSKFGATRNEQTESYLWAIDQGYKIGAIGDSDAHTGLPGKRSVGSCAPNHDHPQGLTAAMTNVYTRRGIMDAYHNRNVYGTTGDRIFLEVKAQNARMGDELRTDENFDIRVEVAGTDEIEKVLLYRGLEEVGKVEPANKKDVETVFRNLRPAEEEKAYAVAVIQKDGNRAFGTPIWVRKKTMPELALVKQGSDAYLVNKGCGEAKDVAVYYSKDEYPYAVSAIEGRECGWKESAAMVWTQRWNDRKTMFHYRWHGKPISGRIKITGAENYRVDFNRDLYFMRRNYHDNGKGEISFTTGKMITVTHSQGFDIFIESSVKEKCQVEIEMEKEVKTLMGNKTLNSDNIIVPINGIKNGNFELLQIPLISANQKIGLGNKKGFYSIDPKNKVIEASESNNLLLNML